MVIFNAILANIINGKNDHCSLCLEIIDENDIIIIQDEISYENEESIVIKEILKFLLQPTVRDTLMQYDSICRKCTKDALSSYKFIKMCQENNECLLKTVNAISCILPLPHQINSWKSLSLEYNTVSCTSLSRFYTKSINTSKEASKSFRILTKRKISYRVPKIKTEAKVTSDDEISIDMNVDSLKSKSHEKIKARKNKLRISNSEMRVNDTKFQCKVCLKIYESLQKLRQHFLRIHAPKTCKCLKCSKSFSTNSLLTQHVHDSHTPVVCTKCGKSYRNRHTLRLHESGHDAKIMCSDCGRYYKHQKTYKNHMSQNVCKQKKRKSNSDARFTCDYCNKKFSQKGTLRTHIQFEHGSREAHVCPWCNKKFFAISRLKAHTVKHTKEKNFSCELCGDKFVTKHSLLYHTRIHTGDKPYECHLCERKFLSSSRRSDHVRRHHSSDKLFECQICHSKFKAKSSLVKHQMKHFNSKSKLYFCDQPT